MNRVSSAVLVIAAVTAVAPLGAQSLLDRPPNLGGTWVPDGGVVQFNFLHRFYVSPSPSRAVTNAPTFTFAVGLPARLAVGTRYSTRSEVPNHLNEIELYGRWRWQGPRSLAVAITPAWNIEAHSLDGELGVDWTRGRVTLSAAARGMSKAYGADRARAALAGGAVVRLNPYVALSGDYASLLNRDPGESGAWSAGLLFVIPGSPHMFSLHASTVSVNTIQGSSREGLLSRIVGKPLYGFEFTIPLHLRRFSPWFKGAPKPVALGGPAGAAGAAEIRMAAFKFQTDSVVIGAGQTVRWVNDDPVEHTITFDGTEPGSPPIPQHGSFSHRFDKPGTYTYHCTPHPYMKGVVVVK
ncbi:MAG TPA: cupredoxin family copper-binding protein [Gemmatimonadales bacterium]|nr:cupredoxin family copper-binding protein [Gemmatimonadales bacterium]